MPHKISENHAKARHIQRTDGGLPFRELRYRIRHRKQLVWLERQSCSRSLCATPTDDGRWVYVIINRNRSSIITVLTEHQVCTSLSLTKEKLHKKLNELRSKVEKAVDKG